MKSEFDIVQDLKDRKFSEDDIVSIIMTYNMLLSFLIARKIEPNKITWEAVKLFLKDLEEHNKGK